MDAQMHLGQRYSPFGTNADTIRQSGWAPIVVFIVVQALFEYVVNAIVFPSGVLKPAYEATRGLVNPTLVAGLAGTVVIGIILLFGRLRKEDVGIRWNRLPSAALIAVFAWVLAQLIGAVIDFAVTGTLSLESSWSKYGLPVMLGLLIGQLFGNALLEEITFRGFLLPQLYLKLVGPRPGQHKRTRTVIALVLSQGIFVLMHIPNRLGQGNTALEWIVDFASVFVLGAIFALVYLRTGNIFMVIGLHALVDAPESLFISGNISKWFYVAFAILIVVLWPRMKRIHVFSGQGGA
jgi:membrane protease YdiL (CAAX protease family)